MPFGPTRKAHPKVAEKEGVDADRHGGLLGHEPGDTLSDIERGKREVGTHNATDHRKGLDTTMASLLRGL